jgi:alpha-beta hydrolase superfamily lysophospholipase
MNRNDFWFESDDGARLKLHRWVPANEGSQKAGEAKPPRAVLHIVHGMAEYSLRYERLAAKLVAAGIEVWAADQRGHGSTADLDVNKPGAGGKLGHCADKDGFIRVVKDINNLNMEIKKTLPGVPLFQLGHSWGSFITLDYVEKFSGQLLIDGCILSGTMGPDRKSVV